MRNSKSVGQVLTPRYPVRHVALFPTIIHFRALNTKTGQAGENVAYLGTSALQTQHATNPCLKTMYAAQHNKKLHTVYHINNTPNTNAHKSNGHLANGYVKTVPTGDVIACVI